MCEATVRINTVIASLWIHYTVLAGLLLVERKGIHWCVIIRRRAVTAGWGTVLCFVLLNISCINIRNCMSLSFSCCACLSSSTILLASISLASLHALSCCAENFYKTFIVFSIFTTLVIFLFFPGPATASSQLEGPGILSSLPDPPTAVVPLALLLERPG